MRTRVPLRRQLTTIPMWPEAGVPAVDFAAKPPPGRFADLDTRFGPMRVRLRETPGPEPTAGTAVLLHGLAGSSSNWTDLAGLLSSRMRSIAVDLPGFGQSEPPEGFDFSREAHAHVVIRLIERLDTGPVQLFGNSFGGAVAIEVAALRPDLVSTLTLISPAMPDLRLDPRRLSDRRIALAWLPILGRRIRRQLASASPRERTERLMRLCFARPEAIPPHRVDEAVVEFLETVRLPWSAPALGRTTTELLRSWMVPPARSLWLLLSEVRVPGLVVWGSEDRLVSVRKAPRTARTLRRGRLLVLPRTGHVAQMERPRVLARAALAMFDEVRAGDW